MKRVITPAIINSLKNLKYSLSPRLFKNNLKMQLSQYELTPEFLEEFIDDIDSDDISQYSLSPSCIYYLIENDKFIFDIWVQDIERKNVDILVDDDFVSKYNIDVNSILTEIRNVSDAIFNKFNISSNSEVRKNLFLNYAGPNLTVDNIMDNLSILQMDIFKIQKIKDEIRQCNSKIQERILNSRCKLNPLLILYLMDEVYIPNEINETIDDLDFIDLDLGDDNPDAIRIIHESQLKLSNIIEKYNTDVINKILLMIYFSCNQILMNKSLLKKILIECDNLDEQTLISINSDFLLTGARDELLQYAKNLNYQNLVAMIAIQ